jgi:organic radical activating enzyme
MEIPEIMERVRRLRCDLVEVTGGEPLIQAETPSLIAGLLDAGHTVLLETNGSIDIGVVDPRCVTIMDIKCPSSGMTGQNDLQAAKITNSQGTFCQRRRLPGARSTFLRYSAHLIPGLSPNGFSKTTLPFG